MIEVLRPGLFTTVQDAGRWGWQRFGIPVAGAMDLFAHRLANRLVGNAPACATLEVTLVGPQLVFRRDALFTVCGADFELRLDDAPAAMDTVHAAGSGQHLTFGARRSGARAYFAVAGGIDVPRVLGSRATHAASRMGGFEGRALAAGDRLAVGREVARQAQPGTRSATPRAAGDRVRVLPGPHAARCGPAGAARLAAGSYRIAPDSDRMGYRLQGPALQQAGPELLSSGVPLGAVQVPSSGEPIVLLADRPTTGGYPHIGTVITADIPRLAQLAAGDQVAFEICDQALALRALITQERALLG